MRRIIIIMCTIMVTLSACTNNSGLFNGTTNEKPINSESRVEAIGQYMTFEDLVSTADVVLKGMCTDVLDRDDHLEYEFDVIENYYGEVASPSIQLYVPNHSVHILNNSISYNTYDIKYEIGSEYYLVLLKRSNPYMEHDRYINVGGNLLLPVSNMSKSTIYGESLVEHYDNALLENENAFIDYITDQIVTNNTKLQKSNQIVYLSDDSFENVMTNSDYIIQVRILEEVYVGVASDRNTYDCIVSDAVFGDIEIGEIVRIVFPSGSVKEDDEIIVALFEFDNCSPRSFVLSSKSSVFNTEKKSVILDTIPTK